MLVGMQSHWLQQAVARLPPWRAAITASQLPGVEMQISGEQHHQWQLTQPAHLQMQPNDLIGPIAQQQQEQIMVTKIPHNM